MLELSQREDAWDLKYGGDTLNTAIHLARKGHNVSYLTALGDSPFSHRLKTKWQSEGIDCSLVLTHPTREVGLYAINLDDKGERSFTYWRGQSAAREMFALPAMSQAMQQAANADLLYFSLITLAILPPEHRELLFKLAQQVRSNGGKVAFDSNYRPRLWNSVDATRIACRSAIQCSDMGFPTIDDECLLWGSASPEQVASHWTELGCKETIIKLGVDGCRLPSGEIITPEQPLTPIDTSGAGDAFNAGYIDARLKGVDQLNAARAGHELAGWTIMRPGGIPSLQT
jgi:2-dehydro-3-deoxygluconokinase